MKMHLVNVLLLSITLATQVALAETVMTDEQLIKKYEPIWKSNFLSRNGFTEEEFDRHIVIKSRKVEWPANPRKHVTFLRVDFTLIIDWAQFDTYNQIPIYLSSSVDNDPRASKGNQLKPLPKDAYFSAKDVGYALGLQKKFLASEMDRFSGVPKLAFASAEEVKRAITAKTGITTFDEWEYTLSEPGKSYRYEAKPCLVFKGTASHQAKGEDTGPTPQTPLTEGDDFWLPWKPEVGRLATSGYVDLTRNYISSKTVAGWNFRDQGLLPNMEGLPEAPTTFAELLPKNSKDISIDYWLDYDRTLRQHNMADIKGYDHWSIQPEGDNLVFHHELLRKAVSGQLIAYDRAIYRVSADGRLCSYDHCFRDRRGRLVVEQASIKGETVSIDVTIHNRKQPNRKVQLSQLEAELAKDCLPLKFAYHIRNGNSAFADVRDTSANGKTYGVKYETGDVKPMVLGEKKVDVHMIYFTESKSPGRSRVPLLKGGAVGVLKSGKVVGGQLRDTSYNYTSRFATKDQVWAAYGDTRIEPLQKGACTEEERKAAIQRERETHAKKEPKQNAGNLPQTKPTSPEKPRPKVAETQKKEPDVKLSHEELIKKYEPIWKEFFLRRNGFTEAEFSRHITVKSRDITAHRHVSYLRVNFVLTVDWAKIDISNSIPIRLAKSGADARMFSALPHDTWFTTNNIEYFINTRNGERFSNMFRINGVPTLAFASLEDAKKEITAKTGITDFHELKLAFYVPGMSPRVDGMPYILFRGTKGKQSKHGKMRRHDKPKVREEPLKPDLETIDLDGTHIRGYLNVVTKKLNANESPNVVH